jgi:acyl carrier protein phosphodiesterase
MRVDQQRWLDMYAELRNLQQLLDKLTASFQRYMLGIG